VHFDVLSGGERKRVNIGIELVSDPSILLLDEPTSGLDSSSCYEVVRSLKRIADSGIPVACVVHQPSYEIGRMFDNVLLLAKGGYTVYYGPVIEMTDYFEKMGFTFPSKANMFDVVMDIIQVFTHHRV
jgi:ABC-type multidrug transport system ATPase subunit